MRRRLLLLSVAVVLVLAASGCSSFHGLKGTGNTQYVEGDGTVRPIPAAERGDPVDFAGQDLDGRHLALSDLRGKPTVVNVWWAGCPPCRKEAPLLVGAHKRLGDGANFVGIDIRDGGTAAGRSFQSQFGITWPSFYSPGGEAVLAFPGSLTPNSVPATVVLDSQGRVAASIIGEVPSELTLVQVVQGVR